MQKVRRDPAYVGKKPVKVYLDVLAAPLEADNEEMEDSIRAAIRFPIQALYETAPFSCIITLQNCTYIFPLQPFRLDVWTIVPLPLLKLDALQKACEAGLHSIVADGMHFLHPKSLGYHAQLYCVHGVCSSGLEIPLMYCITAKKTERTHLKIFNMLKENLTGDAPQRVILDFEKAAIKAAQKEFPRASLEGCSFHIAQAWNRKRDALGLRRHIHGLERDEQVAEWWEIVKGVVFLPRPLLSEVRALREPPVPKEHSAHKKCEDFLIYFQATWMQRLFKDLWCKWKLEELRTTNLAEAFHRRLGELIEGDHPPLSVLIEVLHKLNSEARAALKRLQEEPNNAKVLQKRDQERRAKVAEEMRMFETCYRSGPSEDQILHYCKKMSRYVTEKAI